MLSLLMSKGVVIESGQRADHAAHDGHGVGVAAEAAEEEGDLLVHHGVAGDRRSNSAYWSCWAFAVQQHVADFQVAGLGGQLGDGVTWCSKTPWSPSM
jgi:hypothetical protein